CIYSFPLRILNHHKSLENSLEIMPEEVATIKTKIEYPECEDMDGLLKMAKELIGEVAVVGEVVKPYGPLIISLTDSIRRIYNSYEYAQYNKKISNALLDRVDCVGAPVKALKRRKDKIENNFLKKNYYYALIRLLAILKKTQQFITDVSSLWSLRKFPTTKSMKERFERIAKEFDEVIADLNLEIGQDLELQKRKDYQALKTDINILNEFLENIGSPITTPKKQIKELINNTRPKTKDRFGNVIKRWWKVADKPVACKLFDTIQSQKFQDQLVLLNKLNSCTNLIKFYGLSTLEFGPTTSNTVIVYEWAELGNLKSLYEKYTIDWDMKFEIAVGICRGLLFLHGCDIMHHDVRSKIVNFRLCRPTHDDKEFQNVSDPLEHWMAPEQFRNEKRAGYYTFKCDIFRVPYRGWDDIKIANHVSAGNRENIYFKNMTILSNNYEVEFAKIIRAAWQDDPLLRPGLYKMFLSLDALNKQQNLSKEGMERMDIKLKPRTFNDDDQVIPVFPEFEYSNIDKDVKDVNVVDKHEGGDYRELDTIKTDEFLMSIKPMFKLSDGIKAHERGDHQKAWECFNLHSTNNNPRAKYWKAYYLWDGIYEKKNRELAIEILKEAVNQNDTANNNNLDALYNLGEIYLYGKYNVEKNEEKAIQYLKLASLKEEPRSIELLDKLGIKLFESSNC
ncbi:3077_t:CDS:2, partial [Diversispora eburnea]